MKALLLSILTILVCTVSRAQVPDSVSYQGYLEQSGSALTDPAATLTFRLYDAPNGGSALWTETQTGISIESGVFSVILGSVQDLSGILFDRTLWVSVAVGGGGATELSPRTLLATVPYSFAARSLSLPYADSTSVAYPDAVLTLKNKGGGHGLVVATSGHDGVVVESAGYSGVSVISSTSDGVSIESAGGDGVRVWHASDDGIQVDNANGVGVGVGAVGAAGFWVDQAGSDGVFIGYAGSPSDSTVSPLNNGVEVAGAQGHGLFVGRADGDGVHVNSAGGSAGFFGGDVHVTGNLTVDGSYPGGISGWGLTGNSGTTAGTNFIGTTDNESLELKVNGIRALRLEPASVPPEYDAVNVIAGTPGNAAGTGVVGATISGGGSAETDEQNSVLDYYGTVGGGNGNTAGDGAGTPTDASMATVAGGFLNTASGPSSAVGGGTRNEASGGHATISGGSFNQANGAMSFVGGGGHNQANATYATIGGGGGTDATQGNVVTDDFGTVGGGYDSQAGNNNGDLTDAGYATVAGGRSNIALEDHSTVGGGFANQANGPVSTVAGGWSNHADGERAFVGGGRDNRAGGYASMVPGGSGSHANGNYSFAAGRSARANNQGCFVWGDNSTTNTIECSADHRWIARTTGGVYFYTNNTLTAGAYLAAGGSSWNSVSDRARKEHFAPIDKRALLDGLARIDIASWSYIGQDRAIRHVGPTAQDFNALLPDLGGEGERYINSLDADGVALAAIQELYRLVKEQKEEIRALRNELASVKTR